METDQDWFSKANMAALTNGLDTSPALSSLSPQEWLQMQCEYSAIRVTPPASTHPQGVFAVDNKLAGAPAGFLWGTVYRDKAWATVERHKLPYNDRCKVFDITGAAKQDSSDITLLASTANCVMAAVRSADGGKKVPAVAMVHKPLQERDLHDPLCFPLVYVRSVSAGEELFMTCKMEIDASA
jgi:hypothetical protein